MPNPLAVEKIVPPDNSVGRRPERYQSHALVEVRRFKALPFFCRSGVLLDISLGGFKLEFTSEVKVQVGQQYWLNIPLAPLGIYAPTRLLCRGEVRWFDTRRFRIGGVFMSLTKTDEMIIQEIVETLRTRGALPA